MKYKQFKMELADTNEQLGEGEFKAYVSTFVTTPDSYGDIVRKGAFTRSLAQWAAKDAVIPVLWGHDMFDPFNNIGGTITAEEDEYGLKVHAKLDLENPTARQVHRLVKDRRVTKMSFAYDIVDAGWVKRDGVDVYELRDLDIHEFSVVPLPANDTAEILSAKAAAGFTSEEVEALKLVAQEKIASTKGEVAGPDNTKALEEAMLRVKEKLENLQ